MRAPSPSPSPARRGLLVVAAVLLLFVCSRVLLRDHRSYAVEQLDAMGRPEAADAFRSAADTALAEQSLADRVDSLVSTVEELKGRVAKLEKGGPEAGRLRRR